MLTAEALNDIVEDPTLEWGDDGYFEEDDDLEEIQFGGTGDENDQKTGVVDLNGVNQSSRPTTTKSVGSSLRSDGKRVRLKHPRQPLYNLGAVQPRRDPLVESIVDSRKFSVIENPYTRLAQSTSQTPRPSQRTNPSDRLSATVELENGIKDTELRSHSGRRLPLSTTSDVDTEKWDDGLTGEHEKEATPSRNKSCIQLYEETCSRLSICPCSSIVRSLNTTEINLRNYVLGPRGCVALAAALVSNTTVVSLNLAQNNIGNSGMSYIYQILMENIYIEEYDLSFNNLGTKGICKLAAAMPNCPQIKTLSVAGNGLTASDIQILLLKLDDHPNLKDLDISHNQLEEEGGINVAKWLSDNNILLNLDISWCSIRLTGAKALAKAIGDNNKLISINLSHNSFTNDTIEIITNSLSRNMVLCELNLCGNKLMSRYNETIKENPLILITGKDCQLYKMIVAAATNQTLKIFRLGQNYIEPRCLIIMLESLSKLDNITLEELDLTGSLVSANQILKIDLLFNNHPNLKCYIGPVRRSIENFANNLLNLIHKYCQEKEISLSDMFNPNEGYSMTIAVINYEQFLDGLRKAKIPFPIAHINDIMKYLGRDMEEGLISLRSLIIG